MMRRGAKSKEFTILTNDPSLTSWGWAVVTLQGRILATGCIKTQPESKKKKIRQADDRVRRITEINNTLIPLISKYDIRYILSELPHGSQNYNAATMVGMVPGMVQTIGDCFSIPVEWYSENDTKKFILKKKSATKQEMIDEVAQKLSVPWTGVKFRDEAVADSLAVYLTACGQSQALQLLRNTIEL